MVKLFEPLTIKGITFKNRIVMSPMCQYSAVDGYANDWHMVHLGSRAVGGVALAIVEATSVNPEGRISPGDLGLWDDSHIAPLRKIVDFIHTTGCHAGIQLAHAGRKASHNAPWLGAAQLQPDEGGWQTVAPSSILYAEGETPPLELNKQGIVKIIDDFRSSTRRALEAGFRVVEIHAAHGYLIHEFLSPLTNQRADEYGGSFENRIRLLLEIIDAVELEWPENLPLFVRLSATDWYENGWDLEQTVRLAKVLKSKGVDLIDTSSGGNIAAQKIQVGPCYQAPFAAEVRKSGILTGAVGLITTPEQAENILESEQADLVLFARELLRNPYFALRAARELDTDIQWPVQYIRSK